MNGVHDLGGMDGFGPVVRERNEPIFHADWERRVFGMMLATLGQGLYNLDEIRHSIERMAPAHYLGSTYYEHWLAGLERILGEKGRLTSTEIETRLAKLAAAASLTNRVSISEAVSRPFSARIRSSPASQCS